MRFLVIIAWMNLFLHAPVVAFCDNADAWSKAESFYKESKWDLASDEYAKLITLKHASGEKIASSLFYNYGTALAKSGKYAEAYAQILQSLILDPFDSDARNNLRQIKAKMPAGAYEPIPPQWKIGLPIDLILLPASFWLFVSLAGFGLFFWNFPKARFSGKNAIFLSVGCFFLLAWSVSVFSRSGDFACLKSKSVIRSGPESSFPEIISLEGGAVFSIKEDRGDWLKVSFAASNTLDNIGWVEKKSVLTLQL